MTDSSRPSLLRSVAARALPPSPAFRHVRVGSQSTGALALGAVAIGAFALGALAIGTVAVGRARIRRLQIDHLVVRRLDVTEDLRAPADRPPEAVVPSA